MTRNITTILHISDPHFGTEVPTVMDALKKDAERIDADILLVTGDITQRARANQFHDAARYIHGLPAKARLVIPGNHDIPLMNPLARLFWPYRNYKKAFGKRINHWDNGVVGVIGFDTTTPFRHTRGRLTEQQIHQEISAIQNLPTHGVKIACVHQPLLTAWPEDTPERLIDAGTTAQLLGEYGFDLVLSGHVHVPLVTTTNQSFPALPRTYIVASAGTCLSSRIRSGKPNSYYVITITTTAESDAEITFLQRNFEAETGGFTDVGTYRYKRDTAKGWQSISL